MHRQVGQAIIVCMVALTLCGCSSGFQWPWSKKTADLGPASNDPVYAGGGPTSASQSAKNATLPTGQSGPHSSYPAYVPVGAQPGTNPEVAPAAHTAYSPGGVPNSYDTASTYNAVPTGGAYPPAAYRPVTYPPTVQEYPPAAPGGYESTAAQSGMSNRFGAPGTSTAPGAGAIPQYTPASTYGATPPPGGAYSPPATSYAGQVPAATSPSSAAPPMNTAPTNAPDNPYRAQQYSFTNPGAATTPGNSVAAPSYASAGPYGSVAAPNGGTSAIVDPANTSSSMQPYGVSAQPTGAVAPYGANQPAAIAAGNGAPVSAHGGTLMADNRYGAPRYSTQATSDAALQPTPVDTQPSPPPAAPSDNRYSSSDPFAGYPSSAIPVAPLAAVPASQPAAAANAASGPTGSNYTSGSLGSSLPAVRDVNTADVNPAATGQRSASTLQIGTSSKASTTTTPGQTGNRTASTQRYRNQTQDQSGGSLSASSPSMSDSDSSSSRYRNPLRD